MPLKKGTSMDVVSSNIKEMVKSGYKPKQAIAASLAMKRKSKKMADGGLVEDDDLDQEHERGLFDLMEQGDQPPVANPQVMSMEMKLAKMIQKEDVDDMYAEGGLVEGMSGDQEPEVKMSEPEHVQVEPKELSDEAKKAIEYKKKMRRFAR